MGYACYAIISCLCLKAIISSAFWYYHPYILVFVVTKVHTAALLVYSLPHQVLSNQTTPC